MKKITIRAIGRSTEPWQREGVDMYVDRLKPFVKLEIIELPEGHQGSPKPDLIKTRAREAAALLKGCPEGSWIVALDEKGTELASSALPSALVTWASGGREIVFLIGGSWGLDPAVRSRADTVLSLGKLTLPHGLARIVLLEQLYRAAMIRSGKTYHK